MRLVAVTLCHNFHRRLGLVCRNLRSGIALSHDVTHLICSAQPRTVPDSLDTASYRVEWIPLSPENCINKSLMYQSLSARLREFDALLTVDSDVLPDAKLARAVAPLTPAPNTVYTATRSWLSESVTAEVLASPGRAVDPVLPCESVEKRKWGYFYLCRPEAFCDAADSLRDLGNRVDHYEILLKRWWRANKVRLTDLPGTCYHLFHGPPKSTWKGTDEQY